MARVALAVKVTVEVPDAKVALAAVAVQLPPTVIADAFAESVP